jgi:polyhydroxyalkanoate synthesis regulator phasin
LIGGNTSRSGKRRNAVVDNVESVTLDILKSIQASITQLNERFDHLEAAMRKDRRNVTGMLVMMRATAADFDERVSELEERVAALEATPQ